ncbi:hypothetical protein trd_1111 [Thermomicrobium roseum DSM 5159]|uniref:Uncharacterized protein n=1 Tax=Thermomicrobium roseum (strain ATCC 27502 / DSM 5159 / P-2) TaxID=309801 RepID=B9L0P0_THERP|nr:hypothetical protein trd_1111 [Thermomicrobium roseum DSM 5159]
MPLDAWTRVGCRERPAGRFRQQASAIDTLHHALAYRRDWPFRHAGGFAHPETHRFPAPPSASRSSLPSR